MDSYNSRYPIEYYEIGTPYMFYTDNTVIGKPASADIIHKYSSKFSALQKEKEFSTELHKNQSVFHLSRYVGFVVDMTDNIIQVLYQCRINGEIEFFVTNYITSNLQKAFTDDLEILSPSLWRDINLTEFSFSKHKNTKTKISGVTKANNTDEFTEPFVSRVSGVTKADKSDAVSGVTKADKSDLVSSVTKADKSNIMSGVTKIKHNF